MILIEDDDLILTLSLGFEKLEVIRYLGLAAAVSEYLGVTIGESLGFTLSVDDVTKCWITFTNTLTVP